MVLVMGIKNLPAYRWSFSTEGMVSVNRALGSSQVLDKDDKGPAHAGLLTALIGPNYFNAGEGRVGDRASRD